MKPAISGGGARSGVSRTADKVGDWRRRRRRIGISGRRLRRWVETEWMGGPLDRMGLISALMGRPVCSTLCLAHVWWAFWAINSTLYGLSRIAQFGPGPCLLGLLGHEYIPLWAVRFAQVGHGPCFPALEYLWNILAHVLFASKLAFRSSKRRQISYHSNIIS